jgi:hypothetical protein
LIDIDSLGVHQYQLVTIDIVEGGDSSQHARLNVKWTVSMDTSPSDPAVPRMRLDVFLEMLLPAMFILCAILLTKPNAEHIFAYTLGSIICLRMLSVAVSRLVHIISSRLLLPSCLPGSPFWILYFILLWSALMVMNMVIVKTPTCRSSSQ